MFALLVGIELSVAVQSIILHDAGAGVPCKLHVKSNMTLVSVQHHNGVLFNPGFSGHLEK